MALPAFLMLTIPMACVGNCLGATQAAEGLPATIECNDASTWDVDRWASTESILIGNPTTPVTNAVVRCPRPAVDQGPTQCVVTEAGQPDLPLVCEAT